MASIIDLTSGAAPPTPSAGHVVIYDDSGGLGLASKDDAGAVSSLTGIIRSPLGIADCALWLDASQLVGLGDGDAVTTWPDLSGNGYSPAQDGAVDVPVYKTNIVNGLPIVRFDGVTIEPQILKFSGGALGLFRNLSGVTIAAVTGGCIDNNDYLFNASSGTVATNVRGLYQTYIDMSVDNDDASNGAGDSGGAGAYGVNTGAPYSAVLLVADFIHGVVFAQCPNPVDAGSPTPGALTPGNTPDTDSLVMQIGQSLDGTGNAQADIAEFVVYQRTLSYRERRLLIEYLSDKWGTL